MGNSEMKVFEHIKSKHGDEVFKAAMDITSKDVIANNVNLGKRTSSKQFMSVFFRSLNLCLR